MINAYLICGIISFVLSVLVGKYFIQFIVAAVFLMVLYIMERSKIETEELKKTISEHNELLKESLSQKNRFNNN